VLQEIYQAGIRGASCGSHTAVGSLIISFLLSLIFAMLGDFHIAVLNRAAYQASSPPQVLV
jgi:hypothetical protein